MRRGIDRGTNGRTQKAAGMAEGEGARRRELHGAPQPAARGTAPHGVRGGPVPQHRRLLGPEDGHVHDPGRHLHACLRVLRRYDRCSDRPGPRGAGPPGGDRGSPGSEVRGHNLGQPRRPPGRRRVHIRAVHTPGPQAASVVQDRGADPGLLRRLGSARDRHRGGAGHPQPQHRDGQARVPHG